MTEVPVQGVGRGGAERWSLKGRMLRWLAFTAAVAAIMLSVVGAWFVRSAADRQLDSLLQEELEEVRIAFEYRDFDAVAFGDVVEEMRLFHPGNRLAWRVWNPGGMTVLGEFGSLGTLLPDAPAHQPLDVNVPTSGGYRWRATELRGGYVVGLLVDEQPHFGPVRDYGYVAVIFMVVGFASVFFVGRVFATRVSTLLAEIAAQARGVEATSESIAISREGLPDEVRDVVEALDEMLHNVREETENSRVLIAGIAHELRSPIQNLIGETEVALFTDHDASEYRVLLSSHLEEMHDLRDAVQNLVALCSARRAAVAERVEEFDLIEESRIRLSRQQKRAEREKVLFEISATGETSIHGDREALMTGIRNIVSNAIDWTPEGGRVELRFDGDDERIVITVDDTGPGIPDELRPRIFEPFVRGRAAAGKRIGYGLGLALAHAAVEAQTGTIEVLRSPAGGARFRLTLPRRRNG